MRSALTPLALVMTLIVGFASPARASESAADADAQRVSEMLSGSWKSTVSMPSAGGDAVELVMHAAPVEIEGMPYAMYVEQARADAVHAPTRQAIFELYRHQGELRMRTHEFRNQTGFPNTVIGLWAAPDLFPSLERSDLIATMDVELSASGEGVRGKSPHPYPTGLGGAVEMTSTLALDSGSLTVEDTGFAADGSVAWGGQPVAFAPYESGVEVKRWEEGLVSIEFVKPEGHEATDGDQVAVNYTGWIRNEDSDIVSGWTFDDSTRPGRRPFTLSLPGQVIKGWNEGVPGMSVGTIRQLIIPAAMAYGERGRPPTIPAGATLYFRVQCMDIIRPASAGE